MRAALQASPSFPALPELAFQAGLAMEWLTELCCTPLFYHRFARQPPKISLVTSCTAVSLVHPQACSRALHVAAAFARGRTGLTLLKGAACRSASRRPEVM